jgi:nitroreductase
MRHTVRDYRSTPIEENLLLSLIEKASHASNTGNMQTYSVVITRDEEQKKKLAPAHFNQRMVTGAPVVLTFCADFNRFNKWCEARNAVPGYDNFLSFSSALIDTCLFAEHFAIEAEKNGLGICYLGTTTYNAPQIIETLELPKFVIPITTITVGYPDETKPAPFLEDRLPVEAITHTEKYTDYTQNKIDQYYTTKENLPHNISFVKENNKETLAQIFTDIRYPKQTSDHFSKIFIDILNQQGFKF